MHGSIIFAVLLCMILSAMIIYFLMYTNIDDVINLQTKDKFIESGIALSTSNRVKCSSEKHYCFDDNDCTSRCDTVSNYSCIHGICKNFDIVTSNPNNDCDPAYGIEAFLVGNTGMGTDEYICKSLDDGIAISVTENRMCKGGDIEINYTRSMPSISDCTSDNICLIPSTSQVREYVIVDEKYHDLVNKSYGFAAKSHGFIS
jgi:hypothetical protein